MASAAADGPALAAAGKAHQNCLARQMSDVLQGRRHFSIFQNRGTAIVVLAASGRPATKRLAARLRDRAYASLAEIGFAARPFGLRGDRDYLNPFTAIRLD